MYVILLRKYELKDQQHGVLLLCQLSVKGPLCRDSRAVFSDSFPEDQIFSFSDRAELLRWVFWRYGFISVGDKSGSNIWLINL